VNGFEKRPRRVLGQSQRNFPIGAKTAQVYESPPIFQCRVDIGVEVQGRQLESPQVFMNGRKTRAATNVG
jgi:hypothetical protein